VQHTSLGLTREHGETKNVGWKPALGKAHAVFAFSFVGAQHAAPAAPQGAALRGTFATRHHGFTLHDGPKNKTPRPESGRTFLWHLFYHGRNAFVKAKLNKNKDSCKCLRGKKIGDETRSHGLAYASKGKMTLAKDFCKCLGSNKISEMTRLILGVLPKSVTRF